MGQLDGIACDVNIDGDGVGVECMLPSVDQALDGIDQPILRNGVEETHEVIVHGVEIDVIGYVVEVVVEVVP